jgi:SMC interacting uncharacterized protein involved in chromosome segregation
MKEIEAIKAGLLVTAQEPGVETPTETTPAEKIKFEKPTGRAPSNYPYKEKTLVAPDDARKLRQNLAKIDELWGKLKSADENYTEQRKRVEEKIAEAKAKIGYDQLSPEIVKIGEEVAQKLSQVDEANQEIMDKLFIYKDTLMGVYNSVKAGSITEADKQEAFKSVISKFVSEDITNQIFKAVQEHLANLKKSREVVEPKLGIWPAPEKLTKKVKEVAVESAKTAGVWDTIKSFFSGLAESLKGIWNSLLDSSSSAIAALDDGMPLIEEMGNIIES